MHDQLRQFRSMLCYFSDTSSSILSDLYVHILEAVEDSGEDFSLDDHFCKIDGVLGNLGQTGADLSLELCVRMRDQSSQVWDSTIINNVLSELFGVLCDFGKSCGGDSLQSEFGLLHADDEEGDGVNIYNGLCQLVSVLSNASQGPCGRFFDRGIKVFKTVDQGIKSTGINDSLCEMG